VDDLRAVPHLGHHPRWRRRIRGPDLSAASPPWVLAEDWTEALTADWQVFLDDRQLLAGAADIHGGVFGRRPGSLPGLYYLRHLQTDIQKDGSLTEAARRALETPSSYDRALIEAIGAWTARLRAKGSPTASPPDYLWLPLEDADRFANGFAPDPARRLDVAGPESRLENLLESVEHFIDAFDRLVARCCPPDHAALSDLMDAAIDARQPYLDLLELHRPQPPRDMAIAERAAELRDQPQAGAIDLPRDADGLETAWRYEDPALCLVDLGVLVQQCQCLGVRSPHEM